MSAPPPLPPLLPRLSHALLRVAEGPARTIASPPTQPRRASVALLLRVRPSPEDEARLGEEYDAEGIPLPGSEAARLMLESGLGLPDGAAAATSSKGTATMEASNITAASASSQSQTLGESFTSSLLPDESTTLNASIPSAASASSTPPNGAAAAAGSSASASPTHTPTNANASSCSDAGSSSTAQTIQSFFSLPWVQRGTPELLYIKRSARVGDKWSAHVAFPGGRREEGDENGLYTAMRETWEEVGLDLAEREFVSVGQLDDREITTSLGKRLLMVLSPYVFLQTSPFSPLPDLQPSEVASAHWIPLSLLYTPTPRWGLTSVDIASRLAPKSPAVRWALRALVGKMDFRCVLLPNTPVATADAEEELEFGVGMGETRKENSLAAAEEGEARPELRLWGLTLGMTLDLLAQMSTFPATGLRQHSAFTPEGLPAAPSSTTDDVGAPAEGELPSLAQLLRDPLPSARTLLGAVRDELHLSPPPQANALAPSMTSVFPRFSYPDVNFWIWVFGWRYRAVVRGWERGLSTGTERHVNWSGLALGAFYSAVRRALVVAILLRALGFASMASLLTWVAARRVRRRRQGLAGFGLDELLPV